MRKLFKMTVLTLALTLAISTVAPGFTNSKVFAESFSSLDNTYENYNSDILNLESPTFKQDFKNSKLIFQQELYKNQGASTRGLIGTGLKGIKTFGSIVKNGGHMLSWVLKPFSKKAADAVKDNAAKIGKALAKPEHASKGYVKRLLTDHGVPKDDADLVVKILFILL